MIDAVLLVFYTFLFIVGFGFWAYTKYQVSRPIKDVIMPLLVFYFLMLVWLVVSELLGR